MNLIKLPSRIVAGALLAGVALLPTVVRGAAVAETFSTTANLPPPAGVYVSPAMWHAAYASGIIIRDVRHSRFTENLPAPPAGGTQVHTFGSTLDFQYSTDGGVTFLSGNGSANVSVRVQHVGTDAAGTSFYDTEMLSLDLTTGPFKLRESPTLPSRGKTTVRLIAGGNMISSFFDIFTEISTDGGVTWQAALQAAHVELRGDPTTVTQVSEPTTQLPPPTDQYVSPQDWHAAYAMGIVIKDVKHKAFTESQPAPTTGTSTHHFGSTLDLQVSTDGGTTFQSVQAPAMVTVVVGALGMDGMYDTEMTLLDGHVPVGGLPLGIMIRESPTLPSRGQTKITSQADGTFKIASFFDIFTEVSTDGGGTWSPSTTGPVRMELEKLAPEQPAPSPNLPPSDGEYISPDKWHALYASGIIISNVSHARFQPTTPPPPPGGSQTHTFSSVVIMDVLRPGQLPLHVTAPATVAVRVTSTTDSGNTRYFDTEMLQLNIQGGGLPTGLLVRESPTKASLGRTSIRAAGATGGYMISSFFDIFTEISTDSGKTWSPVVSGPATVRLRTPVTTAVVITCPPSLAAVASGPAGAEVDYTVTAGGGCGGPVTVTCTPPSGSLFPVGNTVVTCVATDPCGNSTTCVFNVTVNPSPTTAPEYFFKQPILPPAEGVYISPSQWHVLYNNGIVIRDIRHRRFTQGMVAPTTSGTTQVHHFGSAVDLEVSTDNGATFTPMAGSANTAVRVATAPGSLAIHLYQTEMSQLDLTIGGIMVRESPTRKSSGQTALRTVPGGYMISSFFDIWTEVSTDGGHTWIPAQGPAHVELRTDPSRVEPAPEPTPLLPPPTGSYVSPDQWHALYAQGIVIKDVRHKLFTKSIEPPPVVGSTVTHVFDSQLDLQVSTDNGATFTAVRAGAPVEVELRNVGPGIKGLFDAEMKSLTTLVPAGGLFVMIRESPTEPSRGAVEITPQSDGTFAISSFFDIFTEVSLDGMTWLPSTSGPARVELRPDAPEQPEPTPNLPPPDGAYISPDRWHALYQNGIIITNVTHNRFTQSLPPPPPGGSQTHTFSSVVEMDVIRPGQPAIHVTPTATVAVRVSSLQDAGMTRYFDTEMLQLNLQGGGLPTSMRVRESPTKASLGRTSVRIDPSGGSYRISSFFDIFTEISTDNGQTWVPMISPPGTVGLKNPLAPPVSIACPANLTVSATSAAGAAVNYTVVATGGCDPVPTITCTPPSGSVFPVGTTTVTCVAKDSCGHIARCTFTVTVKRWVPKRFFPTNLLPPANGQYVSPNQWHALYANGIIITNASHKRFLQSQPPPPPGGSQTHLFDSTIELDVLRPGQPILHVTAPAAVAVRVDAGPASTDVQAYDTEMLQLNIQGGTLPNGMMIRESPTRASLGEVQTQAAPGGYLIGSFFDIFTEISLDGGKTWSPTETPAHMELQINAATAGASLKSITAPGGNPTFSLLTQQGLTYLLEYKENLDDAEWFIVNGVLGPGGPTTQTDYLGKGSKQRFYRVRVEEVLTE